MNTEREREQRTEREMNNNNVILKAERQEDMSERGSRLWKAETEKEGKSTEDTKRPHKQSNTGDQAGREVTEEREMRELMSVKETHFYKHLIQPSLKNKPLTDEDKYCHLKNKMVQHYHNYRKTNFGEKQLLAIILRSVQEISLA